MVVERISIAKHPEDPKNTVPIFVLFAGDLFLRMPMRITRYRINQPPGSSPHVVQDDNNYTEHPRDCLVGFHEKLIFHRLITDI